MIEIRGVHKSFGTQHVLRGIDLVIPDGETIAIVGPSGTGKSVLLKLITGLLPVDAGEILISNRSMTKARTETERRSIRENMGVLFQAAALFDSMTLFDNVAFPLRERKVSEKEILTQVLESLAEVDLTGYETAFPSEVSIGMRKRVGIARALVTKPDIILFDEPNTGLDPETGQEIYELILQTQKTAGFTGIVISHEIPEVFQICSRVVMLYQGLIQADGDIPAFMSSTNPVVRQFVEGAVVGPIQMC